MRSIGGGTVRFAGGVAWIECPERPDVIGECTKAGAIEVLWNDGGKVMESFDTRVGDILLVANGAIVAKDTMLFERVWWHRSLRADIDPGANAIVRWNSGEPLIEVCDEVTGLTRVRFPEGEGAVLLDLEVDSQRYATMSVPRDAQPTVRDGAVVERGEILAQLGGIRRDEGLSGVDALRDFLNARPFGQCRVAVVAPCNGRVDAILTKHIRLLGNDGRMHVVRKRLQSHLTIREGDPVRVGDALDYGQRSHHDLLRSKGEAWLAQHLQKELEIETANRSLPIPRSYWTLVVRAMLAWRRVLRPGDTGLRRHQVLSRRAFDQRQRETAARGGSIATFAPALRGIRAIARFRLKQRDPRGQIDQRETIS